MKKTIILIALFSFIACGKAKMSMLSDRAESFNENIRWSSLKAAASYMSNTNKQTLMDQYGKELQKNQMVEYSILDIAMDESQKVGTVLVEFSFYDNSTLNQGYRQELQTWNFDAKAKNWVVKESRPIAKSQN
jgi:hypothetical protein